MNGIIFKVFHFLATNKDEENRSIFFVAMVALMWQKLEIEFISPLDFEIFALAPTWVDEERNHPGHLIVDNVSLVKLNK